MVILSINKMFLLYSNAPEYNNERISYPRSQRECSESLWPTCSRCGKRNKYRYLVGTDGCYVYGESGHMKKDFRKSKANIKVCKQVSSSGEDVDLQNKNRFFAL